MLVELPKRLTPKIVSKALLEHEAELKYVAMSHYHVDHVYQHTFDEIVSSFPDAEVLYNKGNCHTTQVLLGGEPVYLLDAAKHSESDRIIVFRGIALTSDVELGTLWTCNGEIDLDSRKRAMAFWASFEREHNYKVHTVFSAHLNDLRSHVNFSALFEV
jgi:glyoxylase-like metal-dependent hydrolase (beta-lactamase superfamily II)